MKRLLQSNSVRGGALIFGIGGILTTIGVLRPELLHAEHAPPANPAIGIDVANVSAGRITELPHDPSYFTQGLFVEGGVLYEGTGLYGHSKIVAMDLDSLATLRSQQMAPQYFGEGICTYGPASDKILQLSWKKKRYFVYDMDTLAEERSGSFSTSRNEGWGVTPLADGTLAVSDGSQYLHIWDQETLQELRRVPVMSNGIPVPRLNELETIGDKVYANIWYSDYIVEIDPATGLVTAWLDFRDLYPRQSRSRSADVLNGIAFAADADGGEGRVILTGKKWEKYYVMPLSHFLEHKADPPSNARRLREDAWAMRILG